MNKQTTRPQWAVSIFIVGAVLLGLVPLFWIALSRGGLAGLHFDQSIINVLLFTLKQALLSTVISILLGLFTARALARREFFGKNLLMSLFTIPFALPAIVAVLGISTVYGNQGWLGGFFNIYGLNGILMAHVFFNLPLAAMIMFGALSEIAPERFRLAAQLSFSSRDVFWHVEWPQLRSVLPGLFSLIFLLCAASFVVVLTLGGPSSTTLEVAIYQSLRMDFDVGRALALSILQIIVCMVLVGFASRMVLQQHSQNKMNSHGLRFDGRSLFSHLVDAAAIALSISIVLPPILAIAFDGARHISIDASTLAAGGFSLLIGSAAALLAVVLAWPLAQTYNWSTQCLALAGLIVPPAVLATGWFLALKDFGTGIVLAVVAVIALNSLMALPFSVAALQPSFSQMGASHNQLCAQLGLSGWNRFWRIDLPFMLPALRQAALLAFVLSLGDLTAVTMLGTQGLTTLPALIHQQMGNYRGSAAAGTALILASLCYGLALLAQRLGRLR